ncbi:MAG: DegT/DnrJ/EryC1/StrS family aminotransferase [Bacteroidales bacterium]|jgi:dTDP-4-amino-4,6-dideoxygalactose transaminase|nr:DegT/DnrJ/EryC1/StrS family aminotransferase [Bacteroidales bacterium]
MKRIYLSSPHLGEREMVYVKEAFDSNWIAPVGENINRFQRQLETYLGNHVEVTALSSGTAAIHLALVMLGVNSGDEVICQSFTFAASVNPILYQHAIPVLIDSEEDTWNMSPEHLERAILHRERKGKKPRAIILVDLFGMPAKMNELITLAQQHEIPVIEDAAEALGSQYDGRACGSFGQMGVLSFNGNKIITCSSGGALVSTNHNYVQQAKFYAGQAKEPGAFYQHSRIGYNYQLSNILAGIGCGQMEVLDARIARRREIKSLYRQELADIEGISFHSEPDERFFSNDWLTVIILDTHKLKATPLQIVETLNRQEIECRPVWNPMHRQPVFADAPYYGSGVCERIFAHGLCLPSGSNLSNEDIQRVAAALKVALN